MFYFIKPIFDAKIKVDNYFYEIKKNEFFPISKNYKNITVYGEHTPKAYFVPFVLNEKFINEINYNELNTKIIEIFPNYYSKTNKLTILSNENEIKTEFLEKGKCFVRIKNKQDLFIMQFQTICTSPIIFQNNFYIVIYAYNVSEGFSLIVFNKTTNKFCLNTICYKVTIANNKLYILDFPNTIGIGQVISYDLNNSSFEKFDTYFDECFKPGLDQNNNPIYFFEAVKSNNFTLANSFLTNDMQKIATQNLLTSYFTEYTKIIKNPFKNDKSSYLLLNNNSACDINFSLTSTMLIDNFDKK